MDNNYTVNKKKIKTHIHKIEEITITLLKFTRKLAKYSPRLLVGPPASHGYSSYVNHELQQHKFTIKTKNVVFTEFWQNENGKTERNCLFSLTHDFLTIV
jgi:hypothetical protein